MAGSTLVLVLTDVAGSTRLWSEHPEAMVDVMARHHRIVHRSIAAHGGRRPVDQGEGDAVFAAFTSATAAVESVLEFQRALEEERWPEGIVLRSRVGIHVGEVTEQGGNLFGAAVHRAARIRALGAGGQVLLSGPVLELIGDRLPPGARITDLGTHRLRDLDRPESIHQIVGPGMVTEFPPLEKPVRPDVVLPVPRSSFVGRAREVAELSDAISASRLVTVTGFGGMGKTRLAVEVAAAAARADELLGVRFVDLSTLERPESIGPGLARRLGLDQGVGDPLAPVLRWLRGRRLLLVLDNLEQLLPAAADVVARLLDACPELRVLATSREPLRLIGEQVFSLEPLATPPASTADQVAWTDGDVETLRAFGAVQLFMVLAAAARRGVVLTPSTAHAVAAICVRLEGSPLALELVAVRLRTQSPEALLLRLESALGMAAGGIRDLPARQQTLRATIEWSVRGLGPSEERLLWRLSVFPGSFTADAAQRICGGTEPDADVLPGLFRLVDRSLVRLQPADGGEVDRFDLLVPIREFAAERLTETDPDGLTRDRHADHYLRAARLHPDGTREDRGVLAALVDAEWQNIRSALGRLHERARTADEVAISPMLGRCLQLLGWEGTAISLLHHAADHLDAEDSSDAALSVLIHLAEFEFGADRGVSAAPILLRAHRLLERNGSPEQTVHLAAVDSLMQDRHDPALFDRAYALVTAMEEHGNRLPKWYLTDLWVLAAITLADRRADPIQAQLLGSSQGREHLHLRCGIGANLSWVGRSAEAEELLSVFTDDAVRAQAYPVDRILPLMVLADIRIATGRASDAGRVLDAAAADIVAFDQPWEHAMIRVQRATIDRATGDLEGAAARLEGLLTSHDADEVEGAAAYAHWLLAVIERERGRPAEATAHLRRAWVVAAAAPDENLVMRCLLERCVQSVESAPLRAVQDLAMATTHPVPVWVHFDVQYDTVALRNELERRLGSAAVDAAVADASAVDLQMPAWDGVG